MVECGDDDIVSYLAVVAYEYASMVLEMAAGIDEYVFAYRYVFPEVGVEWREQPLRGGVGLVEK